MFLVCSSQLSLIVLLLADQMKERYEETENNPNGFDQHHRAKQVGVGNQHGCDKRAINAVWQI